MKMRTGHLFGNFAVFASLLMMHSVLDQEYGERRGAYVLLPHLCTHHEMMSRGDGREVWIRYRMDHSSFVNDELMPVKDDLRRKLASLMSQRQEKVITFMADERLTYREVSDILSDLQGDENDLRVLLATRSQLGALEQSRVHTFDMLCMD